jgi:hypothetical protein
MGADDGGASPASIVEAPGGTSCTDASGCAPPPMQLDANSTPKQRKAGDGSGSMGDGGEGASPASIVEVLL